MRRIKGIFRRGNIFWLSCVENGTRIQQSLGTDDYLEAVAKAQAIRIDPVLAVPAPLEAEINAFIRHKLARNEWSADSGASKRHCLRLFAEHTGKHSLYAFTRTDCQRFYDSYEGKVADSTREGYIS